MEKSSVFKVIVKILGPALLGFGTIFQPKAKMTDHWSTSPEISIQVEVSVDDSGEPLGPDEVRWSIPDMTAA